MSRAVASVDEFWTAYEAWYDRISQQLGEHPSGELPPGASEAELEATEKEFGFPLPADLRAFYARHDGAPIWGGSEGFSDLKTALKKAAMRLGIEQAQAPDTDDDFVWWKESYFPVVEDGAGNADVVQCDAENAGLMVNFDHEVGSEPTGETFLEFLQAGLDRLDFYVVSDGELLGRDELPEDHLDFFDGDVEDWLEHKREAQA